MSIEQQIVLVFYFLFSLSGLIVGGINASYKKNPFGYSFPYIFIGSFVWADAFVFGLFWSITSLLLFLVGNWYLFLLSISVFWAVRSVGEILYWINQQFSKRNINPVKRFLLSKYFPGESPWFIFQTIWQSILVISIILSIHFASLWTASF